MGKEDFIMRFLIFILSLLVGIMFGSMIIGALMVVFELELSFKTYAIIFLVSMIFGTWAIKREINGD